jgi:hypothetical protein
MNDNTIHVIYFNAFRSFYISIFYLNNKKYKEAAGFIFKSEGYVKDVEKKLDNLSLTSSISKDVLKSGISRLKIDLSDSKYKLQSSAFLQDVENEDKNTVSFLFFNSNYSFRNLFLFFSQVIQIQLRNSKMSLKFHHNSRQFNANRYTLI